MYILGINTLFYGASNVASGMASRPDMEEELCPNVATSDWLRESITWNCFTGGFLCHKTDENLYL